jgi:hypothetical protein
MTMSGGPEPELVIESLAEIADGVEGTEEREGISEGTGLSLLLSLVLMAIQEKLWMDAPDHGSWKSGPPPPGN